MKKAFTLIELMVVVAIIATLLTITFKIAGIGSDVSARNVTLQRLQRLENALSGYYAAFGSYPPVALHTKRNVYSDLDSMGRQKESAESTKLDWYCVRTACRAQPVAARYPFSRNPDVQTFVETVSRIIVNRINSSDSQFAKYRDEQIVRVLGRGFRPLNSPNQVNGWDTKTSWQEVKIFQFGLMSFLLPRYLFMTVGLDADDLDDCAQWNANNRLSSHPNTGDSFGTWRDQMKDARLLKRIPSQAVCARWMPNFEKMLCMNEFSTPKKFFGIDICDADHAALEVPDPSTAPSALAEDVYLDQNCTILDKITAKDGWGEEFYYYSPPPFQSYRLWSSGANRMTFPPWVPLDSLKSEADKTAAANWMSDDIAHLSK